MRRYVSDDHRPRAPSEEELESGMFHGDRGCAAIPKEDAEGLNPAIEHIEPRTETEYVL